VTVRCPTKRSGNSPLAGIAGKKARSATTALHVANTAEVRIRKPSSRGFISRAGLLSGAALTSPPPRHRLS
jgi:hypothetical protein